MITTWLLRLNTRSFLLSCPKTTKVCRTNLATNDSGNVKSDYIPIYKFQYIHIAAIINRLKLYQTALTAVTIPGSIVLSNFDMISFNNVINCAAVGKVERGPKKFQTIPLLT